GTTIAASRRSKSSRSLVCRGSWARKSLNGMSNWPPFSAMIFCSSPSQSALTALRYFWTASVLLDADPGTGPGTAECSADEQAATRTQQLAAIAIARIRPMSHMIDATELALRLRGQFVAQPLHRRDGLSDCRASVSSLPPRPEPARPAPPPHSWPRPGPCPAPPEAPEHQPHPLSQQPRPGRDKVSRINRDGVNQPGHRQATTEPDSSRISRQRTFVLVGRQGLEP